MLIVLWSFFNSNLKFYQFLELNKRTPKEILTDIDELVTVGYGSFNDLMELSFREILDIFIVRKDKSDAEELKRAMQ